MASNRRTRVYAHPMVGHNAGDGDGEPVAAADARRLGTLLLTRTMNRRPDIGFASYDRLFPSQDPMPSGGFGNLIALPLQRHAREHRNSVFIDDVLLSLEAGRRPVILTERRDHLELLRARLEKFTRNLVVLAGGMTTTERRVAEDGLKRPDTEERLVLATGRYLGEGFDDASLDTLFLTMPISWKGPLAQYVGRLHREHHAKREVIVYDYVDSGVAMLARMALKRQSGYRSLGYEIAAT